jgi:phosphoribosylformylglycinamidine synthase
MLAAISPENLPQVDAVLGKYPGLQSAVLGEVNATDLAVIRHRGQVDVSLPVRFVVDGFPRIDLNPAVEAGAAPIEALKTVLDLCEALQVRRTMTPEDTAGSLTLEPIEAIGQMCSAVEFPSIGKSILLRTISGDADTIRDPIACGRRIVRQAFDDLRSAGAQPLALCDGLNFGDPESPQVAHQIVGTILGIADACQELSLPVVGGNVSLYNETGGRPILGQAFIAMIGVKSIPGNADKSGRKP